MHILLVGGGTGGHLFPLVAVCEQLKKEDENLSFHFVIAKNNSDKKLLEPYGWSYDEVPVAKLRRYFSWENIRDFFRFFRNIGKAFFILKKQSPEKIFSKGGFVSLPVGIAAWILKIPFILHETDSSMGLANRILSHFASKVLTGFPSKNPKHIHVGNPIRNEFFKPTKNSEKNPLEILIYGGSQGAAALNNWARKFFEKREEKVLLVTGKGKKQENSSKNITEVEFLHKNFIEKIHNADIVITRAGGGIFELAASKKCTVLVPLPSAANDHQRKNAKFFAEKNAAIYREEKDLFTKETKNILEEIFSSKEKRAEMEKNISALASQNASKNICNEILE